VDGGVKGVGGVRDGDASPAVCVILTNLSFSWPTTLPAKTKLWQ